MTFGVPDPLKCAVVVRSVGAKQIATFGAGADCQGVVIWLDLKRGGVLVVSYGITTANTVIASSDVEISREDGGLSSRQGIKRPVPMM